MNSLVVPDGKFDYDVKKAFSATTLEVIMRIAFGVEGDFITPEAIKTDTLLYKKSTASLEGFSSHSYIEDFFWILFALEPSLLPYVLSSFLESADGNAFSCCMESKSQVCREITNGQVSSPLVKVGLSLLKIYSFFNFNARPYIHDLNYYKK